MSDMSKGELIDRIGQLSHEIKRLEAELSETREELVREGVKTGDCGAFFVAQFVEAHVQSTLDRKRLEADKGEAFLTPYLRFSPVKATVKVKPRVDIAIAAMAAE